MVKDNKKIIDVHHTDANQEAEDIKDDKKNIHKFVLILPLILSILVTIASIRLIVTHFNTTSKIEGADNVLLFVHNNLRADPMTEVENVETSKGCSDGFELAELGEWRGIDKGCICGSGKTYTKDSNSKCMTFSSNGCSYQFGEKSEDLDHFNSENREICTKVIEDENVAHCDTGKNTKCGNNVCLEGLSKTCPGNKINATPITPASVMSSTVSSLGNPNAAPVTWNPTGIVIDGAHNAFVQLKATQGKDAVCLDENKTFTENKVYALDTEQSEVDCGRYGGLGVGPAAHQIVKQDTALANKVFAANDIDEYQDDLINYTPSDYESNKWFLYAVRKIELKSDNKCQGAYDNHLRNSAYLARHSRTILRVFAWILVIFVIIALIFGILFILATFSKVFSTQHNTKVNISKLYWFSSWVIVVISVLMFLYYHIFINFLLKHQEEKLTVLKDQNCFPNLPGINLAVSDLKKYNKDTRDSFEVLINEIFIYALVYTLIWVGILVFWRQRYSQIKSYMKK